MHLAGRLGLGFCLVAVSLTAAAQEREMVQAERALTVTPKNHDMDNNENFSADGKYICYDTREMLGVGIDNSQTVDLLEVATGREIVLYRPDKSVTGANPAPGVGAVSFNPSGREVAFIHGPMVDEVSWRGPYGKPNRTGARAATDGTVVQADGEWRMLKDGKFGLSWYDKRDIATDRDTIAGAHRGGTHRHEFCATGARIGLTYDDFLLKQYDRTIGYMERNPKAPQGALCWFAVLVAVPPMGQAKPGELEKAYGDSWVDPDGTMRAFIGKVRNDDGQGYQESLYVVDIPKSVDITTSDSGSATRYPAPPKGLTLRRLTHDWAGGVVRGAPDGARIAYFGKDAAGETQVFAIAANGSDKSDDPALRPMQVTRIAGGVETCLRWHPSGRTIFVTVKGGIAAATATPGPRLGETVYLTPRGDGAPRHALVVSPDGKTVTYNRLVPTKGPDGNIVKNHAGLDLKQILAVDFPDADRDGLADPGKG
jgi:hypothetical protein